MSPGELRQIRILMIIKGIERNSHDDLNNWALYLLSRGRRYGMDGMLSRLRAGQVNLRSIEC